MTRDKKTFLINDIIFHNADFIKLDLASNSVDLIITSPPYNIGIDYAEYDDNKTYKDYLEFTKNWLTKCFETLKEDRRICINIPIDTGKNGKRSLMADVTILAKRTGSKYKGTIIWNPSAALRASKHAMTFSRNIEVILVLYKENWKPVKKEYKDYVNEIWNFSGESKKRVGHPAPFPVEIPRRLIKMFSSEGNTILDPFSGSGTTLVACQLLGRKGIGVEISEEYFEIIKERFVNKRW